MSYQFDAGIAPYISYSTSFDPLLGTDYQGDTFIPVESRQTEVGIKYHPDNSSTLLSAAVFQLNQTNVKTSDAEHLGFSNQAGEVRTRGLDLQATTQVAENTNAVLFKVLRDATKPEIKAAVELMFKVQVKGVSVVNQKGKTKRFGKTVGRRDHVRKAYVTLQPGQELNFGGEAA